MEICEFKAWFEGFTEDMSGQPNAKQWKRVKARVKQIDGTPTTERVFIDRYWGQYQPYWSGPIWSGNVTTPVDPPYITGNVNNMTATAPPPADMSVNDAFTALGKAEAQSIC